MAKTEAPVKQRKEDRHSSIYSEYAHGLRRRCLRLTGDATAADDLAQEVFARFLARFEDLPADLNVPGYLNTTAHNIWMNQLRKDGHVVVGDLDETLTPDDRLENDPVRRLLLAEQRTAVQRGTAGLPERQRRALALRELDDRSYAEIGAEMGMRTNAVAQVVWRARTQLRRALRRSQVDADLLPQECRARLDAMSDFVDNPSNTGTAELRSHMADCRECRRTLAAYQEAGSGLRGLAPFIPIVAIAARMGTALRAGAEAPLSIGTAAAVTAAVVATAGGGGALMTHYAATTGSRTAAPRAIVQRAAPVVPGARGADRGSVWCGTRAGCERGSAIGLPAALTRDPSDLTDRGERYADPAPCRRPCMQQARRSGGPRSGPGDPAADERDTTRSYTLDVDTKAKADKETKAPPGQAKAPPAQTKMPAAGTRHPDRARHLPVRRKRHPATRRHLPVRRRRLPDTRRRRPERTTGDPATSVTARPGAQGP